jgi:Putative oxidoreductase C terminal domain
VTRVDAAQFSRATGLSAYPDYLKPYADAEDVLNIHANGTFTYRLRGVFARVSVEWRFEPKPGTGDSHHSVLRGSTADLIIRQGEAEKFKPTLTIEKRGGVSDEAFERALKQAVTEIGVTWPGVEVIRSGGPWVVTIPDRYKDGHEAHFTNVTASYLKALRDGQSPPWEIPNLLTKYHTLMQAYSMSR